MMTEHNRTFSAKIWQALSNVRDVMPDTQLQQLAIAFTILRRIDCLIERYAQECESFYKENSERLSDERLAEKLCEISGGYPFYNYSGYTFKGILTANNSLDVVFNSYFQGFSKNVQEFLDGMNFNQNLAIMLRQSRYLVDLFEFLSEMDMSASSVDNEEFLELISSLMLNGPRDIYTPRELSDLICECLIAKDVRISKEGIVSIYDPVCGTGGMLANAGEKAKSFVIPQDKISLYGQDVSSFPSAIAKALVLLTGNEFSKVCYGNTLTEDQFPNNHFQYILADMPFRLQWKPLKERIEMESCDTNGRFSIGLPSVTDSQFLFIEHILSKMDPNGCRAAFISTGYVLWGGNTSSGESRIRRWLFENDMVETIMALPGELLSNKSIIPIYLWILSNKKDQAQKGKVRLINLYIQKEKGRRLSIEEGFIKSVVALYKSWDNTHLSHIVSNEQFGFYEVGLLENSKKKETVRISLDTDIEQYIEKEHQPFTNGKITVDYSSVEKGYSVYFNRFFKSDESEVNSLKGTTDDALSVINAMELAKPFIQQIGNLKRTCPEDNSWTETPLRLATKVTFGITTPPVVSEDGLPILTVPYLRKPSGDERYEVTPKTKCATKDDVLIIVKGANSGEVFKGMDGILTSSLAAIKCTDESVITSHYMYYLLKGYEKSFMSMAKGASIKSIDAKMIPNFKCPIPPIEEQIQISEYLDTIVGKIDKVIESLQNEGGVFLKLRQALIENIVQGIWRIPNK